MLGIMRILDAMLLSLLALTACTHPETAQAPDSEATPKVVVTPMGKQLAGAVTTPLHDLNLLRAKIPAALLAAHKAPYAPPVEPGCEGLATEIRQLDAALGEDLDAPSKPGHRNLLEQGRAVADDAAVGAVRHAAEDLIPYRGWVRKLTGAERYSHLVTAAIGAGIVRRAYLKGLGEARGCQAPASPQRPATLPPVAPSTESMGMPSPH
jgi:hypothetical protein